MAKIGKVQEVAVDELIPYQKNAKIHGEDQIERLKASIMEFGFLTPCLIDKKKNLIAGHGRVMAAKALGMERVPCVYIEGLTEAQRKAYILADNRLGELGEWDMEIVLSELEELKDMDFDIELTGFEIPDEIEEPEEEPDEEDDFDDIEKREKHYGVPYQGNKSRIADIIISLLPSGKRLVDLFGGGGAITHCALLSGKWKSFLYNDINEMITSLFMDAVKGKYHDDKRVISREEFESQKDSDAFIKYIWSFGNNGNGYLWGKEIEDIKCAACRMITADSVHESRKEYAHLIHLLSENKDILNNKRKVDRLQNFEHLQALNQLESLRDLDELKRLEVSNIDYREYKYKEGDVVYCDVPYEQVGKKSCDDYGIQFDSVEFYKWVKSQPCQVFFSSYEISDKSFYKVKVKSIATLIGSNTNGQFVDEYLYSNMPIQVEKPE